MSYLTFLNDHDVANPNSESVYRNFKIYDLNAPPPPNRAPDAVDVNAESEATKELYGLDEDRTQCDDSEITDHGAAPELRSLSLVCSVCGSCAGSHERIIQTSSASRKKALGVRSMSRLGSNHPPRSVNGSTSMPRSDPEPRISRMAATRRRIQA